MTKLKRITVAVNEDIDIIVEKVRQDTGIKMTYVQIINFLIHYYRTHANEPKTRWKSLS